MLSLSHESLTHPDLRTLMQMWPTFRNNHSYRSSSHTCIFEDVVSTIKENPSQCHGTVHRCSTIKPHTKTNCYLETLTSLYASPLPQDSSSNKHIIVDFSFLWIWAAHKPTHNQAKHLDYLTGSFTPAVFILTPVGVKHVYFIHCPWSLDVNMGEALYGFPFADEKVWIRFKLKASFSVLQCKFICQEHEGPTHQLKVIYNIKHVGCCQRVKQGH